MSDEPEVRYLGDLQRLDLKPGDTFVLSTGRLLTPEHHATIQKVWRRYWEPAETAPRLLILDGGIKLGVVSAEAG